MEKKNLLICFFVLGILLMSLVQAENPTVRVVGKGVVRVQPDITIISVSVVSKDDDRTEALAEIQQKMNQTKDALFLAGINKDDVSQGNAANTFSMQSRSCRTINNTTTCEYSNLSRLESSLVVKMNTADQKKVNKVLEAANDTGAEASVIGYELSDPDKVMSQALDKADENAKAKGEAYASGEGYRLGKMLDRNEIPFMLCSMGDLDFSDPEPSESGIVKVKACVQVVYELIM
jgi:uncharacterized protein YggE